MSSSLARSVVSGLTSPKLVRPSSNVHQRVLGMPSNVDRRGSIVRVVGAGRRRRWRRVAEPSLAGSTSTLYQSRWPW